VRDRLLTALLVAVAAALVVGTAGAAPRHSTAGVSLTLSAYALTGSGFGVRGQLTLDGAGIARESIFITAWPGSACGGDPTFGTVASPITDAAGGYDVQLVPPPESYALQASSTVSGQEVRSTCIQAGWSLGGGSTVPTRTTPTPTPTPPAAQCLPYIVIDSRGSGAAYATSPPGAKFVAELKRLKGDANVGVIRNPYPAVGWTAFLGAVLQLPAGYHRSADAGEKWLRDELAKETKTCAASHTRFFLTGISQGAQIAGDIYQRGSYPAVVGVALFGEPYFNNRDAYIDRGDYERGLSGTLGTRPIFDKGRRSHVLSFCHKHDPVCQGPLSFIELARYSFSRHANYDKLGEPERAAQYFANFSASS
jgi:hypothetical protein